MDESCPLGRRPSFSLRSVVAGKVVPIVLDFTLPPLLAVRLFRLMASHCSSQYASSGHCPPSARNLCGHVSAKFLLMRARPSLHLPRQARLAEVTVIGSHAIYRAQEVQALDDCGRVKIELSDEGFGRARIACAEGLHP